MNATFFQSVLTPVRFFRSVGWAGSLGFLSILAAEPITLTGSGAHAPVVEVQHRPLQPHSGQSVQVTAKLSQTEKVKGVTLQYQLVDPGHYVALADVAFKTRWIRVPMRDDGLLGDARAGDGIYTVELPETLQTHRRLVRYQVVVTDLNDQVTLVPARDQAVPNFAYFVYDGVPGWKGAVHSKSPDPKARAVVEFSPAAMRRVQVYQLIAKDSEVKAATWFQPDNTKEYRYTGTFVAEGQVYDHVRFRARGGVWRHAMGKNMWKVDFNKGQALRPKDDYGQPYPAKWSKLNLRACIQQGDYGERGEQGMFESVGFRLFNLANTAAPFTHWVQWRIVSGELEAPASQYEGDFWGLYLAIENEDGNFLKDHSLPDGNVYKMMNGEGELAHQGGQSVTNSSDIHGFLRGLSRPQPSSWWQNSVALEQYYSYRSILESIHHYDVVGGKNYTFYFHPDSKRVQVVPWDIDLTWANQMYGDGHEPFRDPVLSRPEFQRDYQNRLREIRDLLFNPEQAGQLIDECAAIIWDPTGSPSLVDADRIKWDYHPIMVSQYVYPDKAGQGKFYEASPTRDFTGMVEAMKAWVKSRSRWIDSALLTDRAIPETPKLERGPAQATDPHTVTFHCSDFGGKGSFAAQQWRVAEVSRFKRVVDGVGSPGHYEITPHWQSSELTHFESTFSIPDREVVLGHTYRARVRLRDNNGRWSHWSAPVEFTTNP